MSACWMQGKDKPTYSPERDEGDIVVVTNARHVEFTGKKWDQKLYRWHTGYDILAADNLCWHTMPVGQKGSFVLCI